MSAQVTCVAVVPIASGKMDRFKELMADTFDWVHRNEPDTLQFQLYSMSKDKMILLERCKNAAAREAHQSTENYAKLFKTFEQEGIVSGEPQQFWGDFSQGFIRNDSS